MKELLPLKQAEENKNIDKRNAILMRNNATENVIEM